MNLILETGMFKDLWVLGEGGKEERREKGKEKKKGKRREGIRTYVPSFYLYIISGQVSCHFENVVYGID